jgi:hypothetical protein
MSRSALEDSMLPTTQLLTDSKKTQIVRVGPLRLYFGYLNLIAFQVDGEPPVVCANDYGRITTARHLSMLESDKTKWVAELEFARRWLEISKMVFQVHISV